MKLKMSYFNPSLILSNIKRFWWFSALYLLVLLIMFPLRLLQYNYISYSPYSSRIPDSYFLLSNVNVHGIFLWIVPVITAVLTFKYIHKPRSVTMLHSLPLNRTEIFINQTISGLILMLTPVALNGLLMIIISKLRGTADLSIGLLLSVTGLIALLEILIYSITLFIGMLTGNSAAHLVFTYVFQLVPIAVYYAVTSLFTLILIGYTNLNSDTFSKIIFSTPLMKGFNLYYYGGTGLGSNLVNGYRLNVSYNEIIIYGCAAILFTGAALLMYRFRRLETATDIVSFNIVKPIFKYGITFAVMILGSVYIMGIVNMRPSLLVLLIWSLIGYCTTEMLLQKTYRIWRSYKGFIGYSVVIIAVYLILSMDLIGFVNKVPDVNNVQRVYLGDQYTWTMLSKNTTQNVINGQRYADPKMYTAGIYEESQNIESVIKAHKDFIETEKKTSSAGIGRIPYPQMYIIYTLKDGSQIARAYNVDFRNNPNVQALANSKEYTLMTSPFFAQNVDNIVSMVVGSKMITSKNYINELIPLIKDDIKNFEYTKKSFYISVKNSNIENPFFVDIIKGGKTEKWLSQHGISIPDN